MSCEAFQEDLVALFKEELETARADEVRGHLDSCADCAAEFQEIEQTFAAVRALPTIQPSADFEKKLAEKIEKANTAPVAVGAASRRLQAISDRRRRASRGLLRLPYLAASAAAAAAILLVASVFVFEGGTPPDREPSLWPEGQIISVRNGLLDERRQAMNARSEARMLDGVVAAADLFAEPDVDSVIFVGHKIKDTDERCLMAYSPGEWKAYVSQGSQLTGIKRAFWYLRQKEHQEVPVVDGMVTIPPELLKKYIGESLGRSGSLAVIRLVGRSEIWAPSRLDRYQQNPKIVRYMIQDDAMLVADWRRKPI